MTTGAVITTNGKNAALKRVFESAAITPVTQFKIGTGTTTPNVANTDVEAIISGWNGGSDACSFLATPVYDLVNSKVTVQGYIGLAQANGSSITENGCFNSDGTPIMFSHDVHAPITKTSTIEVIITWVFQITD